MYLYLLQTIREDVAEFKCNTNFAKVSTFVFVVHVNVFEFSCTELQRGKIFDIPAALKRMDRGQKCVREAEQKANALLFPFFHSCLCLSLCPRYSSPNSFINDFFCSCFSSSHCELSSLSVVLLHSTKLLIFTPSCWLI